MTNLKYTIATVIILVLISICFFWGLGSYGLLHNNEGLYAEIAREMWVSDQYIIPYLNGVPYIEKPPLLYWLLVGSYKVFGVNEFAARVVPAVFGLMTVILCTLYVQRLLSQRMALLTMLIMGTSIGYCIGCRTVFFDSVFTFFLTTTLLCYQHWYSSNSRLVLRCGYIALAAAIMTKGLVAIVLTGCVVLAYNLLIRGSWLVWLKVIDFWGLLLLVVITVPWHYQAAQLDSNFTWFYFINEHFLRFLGLREPHDYYSGPWYYYVHRVLVYLAPWSLLLGTFMIKKPQSESTHPFIKFLWTWFLSFFIFFSLSKAKANYYLIAALPPLVIVLAHHLDYIVERRPRLVMILAAVLPVMLGIIACYILIAQNQPQFFFVWSQDFMDRYRFVFEFLQVPLLHVYIVCGVVAVILILTVQPYVTVAFVNLGMVSSLSIISALTVLPLFEDQITARSIVGHLQLRSANVCLYRDFEKMSSFVFYMRRPLIIVDSRSNDLLYGQRSQRRPDLFVDTALIKTQPDLCPVFIVHDEQLHDFQSDFPNYNQLYKSPKVLVFSDERLKQNQ